jgi:hypothetical protein
LQTIRSTSTASHATPVAALSHALVSTCAHHAADWSVGASQMSQNQRSSSGRPCRRARPCTAASIVPKLAQAPAPAILTARELNPSTKSCSISLQTAAMSDGGTRGDQTVERPHCCPSARVLPPNARAGCRSIAATATSSFPASVKGGTSTCGSTASDSRKAHPCGKGESGEREGSGAGAAGVQVHFSTTRRHCPCLITTPRTLVLPHAVSSLMILRDRGDGGDSQKSIQAMQPSTSATLMVVLTTHRSEESARFVHGERREVATAPPRGLTTASGRENKVLNLFACSTYVREW